MHFRLCSLLICDSIHWPEWASGHKHQSCPPTLHSLTFIFFSEFDTCSTESKRYFNLLLSDRRIYSLPLLHLLRLLLMLLCGNWPSTMSDLLTLKPPFVCTARVSGFCRGNYNQCAGRIPPPPPAHVVCSCLHAPALYKAKTLGVAPAQASLYSQHNPLGPVA